jgi:glucose/arabinose dehydrogenase
VLVILLSWPTMARAQESRTFYLPVLQASSDKDLGIALSNPSLVAASIRLTARDYGGTPISGSGITNPATMTVPPSGQRALRAEEIFGTGIVGRSGWIEIQSSVPSVTGCFMLFDHAVSYIDGANLPTAGAQRLIFPKATQTTQVYFINLGLAVPATLFLYDNGGRLTARKTMVLGSNAGYSGPLSLVFPELEAFNGYLVLEKDPTLLGIQDALVGFETYANRSDIGVLNGVPDTVRVSSGYFPHFVSQGAYASSVSLVNRSLSTQTVVFTAMALEVNGKERSPSSVIAQRTIPPLGRLEETASSLFGFTGSELVTGAVRWEAQSGTAELIGTLELRTNDGVLLSSVPSQNEGASDFFFPHVAEGGGFYTGLALLNANATHVLLSVESFDRNGASLDRAAFTVAPGQRRTRLLSEILPDIGLQVGGYVRVSSNQPVLAMQVFGTTGLSVLAQVLTPGIQLAAQASGSVVRSQAGALVVSQTGEFQIVIPPRALVADTSISIEAPAQPLPALTGREIVASIDALPSGTTFQIPVRLSLQLSTELDPGSELPVLVLDPGSRQYTDSGFRAVVNESGRVAVAFITHFTTLVLGVSADRILSVSDISPPAARIGAEVMITGTGFSSLPSGNQVTFAGPGNTSVAAEILSATPTRLTVKVPGNVVTGYVIVRANGKTSRGIQFTVDSLRPSPSLTSITPGSTVYGTGTVNLTLVGADFAPSSVVRVGDVQLQSTYVDSTRIVAVMANTQLLPGGYQVRVVTPSPGGGISGAREFSVGFPVPSLTGISPAGALVGQTVDFSLSGTGFFPQSTVWIDNVLQPSSFIDRTAMSVRVTSDTVGRRVVTVVNPAPAGGSSNTSTFDVVSTVNLAVVSGDNQGAFHGTSLPNPFVVRVTDPFGAVVRGAPVRFEVLTGSGSVSPAGTVSTDANGLASATATLGDALGTQTFRAVSEGFPAQPVNFSATARTVALQPFISGLSGNPAFLVGAGDGTGRKFIVELAGRILLVQPGASSSTVFLDIASRVVRDGEQGLLGLAFHPQYSTNRRFFVNYTRAGDGATVIAEYHASSNPNVADTTETVLLTIAQPFTNHNGGMLAFGPDGFLYIGMGDGGAGQDPGNRAQNNNELLGKMLRIDVDHSPGGTTLYSSPATNPFFGSTPGRDEIFATGFRNPWRFSFDRETGQLYVGDVGEGHREEIDIVENGGNYGWRVIEGTRCTDLGPAPCDTPGFVRPIAEYEHGEGRCSVTGGYVYRGSQGVLPAGAYIYGDYCSGEIFMLYNGATRVLLSTGLNISSFGQDEAGELYVVHIFGSIHRIVAP